MNSFSGMNKLRHVNCCFDILALWLTCLEWIVANLEIPWLVMVVLYFCFKWPNNAFSCFFDSSMRMHIYSIIFLEVKVNVMAATMWNFWNLHHILLHFKVASWNILLRFHIYHFLLLLLVLQGKHWCGKANVGCVKSSFRLWRSCGSCRWKNQFAQVFSRSSGVMDSRVYFTSTVWFLFLNNSKVISQRLLWITQNANKYII